MKRKIWTIVFILACSFLMCTQTVFAHKAVYEEKGGTKVFFGYSDGSSMVGARIIVNDKDGNKLGSGSTNSDGIFDYEEYSENAASIICNDGEGHMVTYEVPDELPPEADEETLQAENSTEQVQENPAEESTTKAKKKTDSTEGKEITSTENTDKKETTSAETTDEKETAGETSSNMPIIIIVVAVLVVIAVFFSRKSKK